MDEIERQLRRYADVAEEQVPATPEVPTRRRSWRPLLAAAAVVALLGGSLTVLLAGRGAGERVDTTPAEPSPTTVPLRPCPTPDPEPRPDQLQMALPFVARAQVIEDSVHEPDVHHLLIRPGDDDSIEVEVHARPPVLAVVAGMSWPAPMTEEGSPTTVAPEPCPEPDSSIAVGSFTLTAVPEGFDPMLPVEEHELGPGPPEANAGGPTATLSLVHPDGGTIEVISFGAQSPRSYIASTLGGEPSGEVDVRRCIPVQGGWEREDSLAVVGTNGGRTMLAAQEWEYEGYLVIGSPQVDRATLIEVAEALRFGFTG